MLAPSSRPQLRVCAPARRTPCVRCFKDDKQPVSVPKKAPAKEALGKANEKKPKAHRAPSAFNLFVKATFPQVKKEHPEMKFADAGAVVREQWLNATPETKAPYQREAAELKAHVDVQRAAALAEKKAKTRPPSGYILFTNRKRSAVVAENPGMPITEVATLLGRAWKQLSVEEQQTYKDEAKVLLDAWKAKQASSA